MRNLKMTSATPPQDLQVVAPVEPKVDHVDPVPPEDRILSPEETENFFRTGSTEPAEKPTTPEEKEQTVAAGEHFEGIKPEGRPVVPPAVPPAVPAVVPPEAAAAAVQADQPVVAPAAAGVPPAVAPPAVAPAAVPPVVPPVAPVQQTPQESAMQGQIQGLLQQVQNLTQQVSATNLEAQRAGTTAPGAAPAPVFNMQVPQQYADAIASEDPAMRAQAINGLVNGVAETVYRQTMTDVGKKIEQLTPNVQAQVQEATNQAEIVRDMYGTYPELNGMRDMVVATATQLQGQNIGMFNNWSPDFRDAIAERLSPLVPGLQQRVAQNRATRGIAPVVPQQQAVLPQVPQPQALPPGVSPVAVQGGVHVPTVVPGQPVIVRDAQGNLSTVYPQTQQPLAGQQARPNGQSQVDAGLQDVWSTLGFPA